MRNIKKLTLGDLREFTKELPNTYEIRISSIQIGEQRYHSNVCDITSNSDNEGNFVILEPSEIEIESDNKLTDLDNLADYLIENASECFEHQDREELIKVLKKFDE